VSAGGAYINAAAPAGPSALSRDTGRDAALLAETGTTRFDEFGGSLT
jgi:hypothetical protein